MKCYFNRVWRRASNIPSITFAHRTLLISPFWQVWTSLSNLVLSCYINNPRYLKTIQKWDSSITKSSHTWCWWCRYFSFRRISWRISNINDNWKRNSVASSTREELKMSMKSYTARCSSNLILIFKRASLKTGCVLVDNMCIGARTSSPDVLHLDFTLVRPIVAQNFSRREVFCPHRALASLPVLLRCSFKYILFNYLSDLVSLAVQCD